MPLQGKNIVLGITGGIAAYKIPYLIRLLIKSGANVRVMVTPAAKDFVSPITLATLSKNPVVVDFIKNDNGTWNNHVEWGLWADLFVFAPVTANTLAKMAIGQADNFLTAVYMSAKAPVFIAPAMDLDMYRHPATQKNIQTLKSYGHHIIPAATGELASGLTGPGRMQEPEVIFSEIKKFFSKKKVLKNKKILITGGPTYEALDPVRFIGNHSSGKMGIALAEKAAELGAEVELILGPTHLSPKNSSIKLTRIQSAKEMFEAVMQRQKNADIIIMSAAVADFTPEKKASNKIKKTSDTLELRLIKTQDILKNLGENKKEGQILVGFAMETENELENAQKKLKKKNLDLIVLNSLNEKNAGFKYDTNKVTIIDKNLNKKEFSLKSKIEVANDILNEILKIYE